MPYFLTFVFCLLTWVVFSGKFDVTHLSMGVIASLLVTRWSTDLLWGGKSSSSGFRLSSFPKLVSFLIWLLWEIFLANLHVFAIAFKPRVKDEIEPHIIRFKTSLKSDFARFVLGNSITLTPGTVTLKITGDEFTVHALTLKAAEDLPGEMERRIAEVFDR